MKPIEVRADVSPQAVSELERVAVLEGITVEELARLVLEEFAFSQEPPSWSVPEPVDWRSRFAPRRGLVAVPRSAE